MLVAAHISTCSIRRPAYEYANGMTDCRKSLAFGLVGLYASDQHNLSRRKYFNVKARNQSWNTVEATTHLENASFHFIWLSRYKQYRSCTTDSCRRWLHRLWLCACQSFKRRAKGEWADPVPYLPWVPAFLLYPRELIPLSPVWRQSKTSPMGQNTFNNFPW